MKNYIPYTYYVLFMAIIIFISKIVSTLLALLLLIILVFIFYSFRKKNINIEDYQRYGENAIFSPVSGKVLEINDDTNNVFGEDKIEIRIMSQLFDDYGLYFPFRGEVELSKHEEGKSVYRNMPDLNAQESLNKKSIIFSHLNNSLNLSMLIVKCRYGLNSVSWVDVGDRGKTNGCFGLFPFGGTIILYIDKHLVLRIKKGDFLESTRTPIASMANLRAS
jgi:hypothetical protein